MPERDQMEATLVAHLPLIERLVGAMCRRHGFGPEEVDDATSWVKLRLVEDDYAVLRKFRGESRLSTYLTVVVAMALRDYRAQEWGRWRPSAAARHLGADAVRLETLVYRDGLGLREAVAVLLASGRTRLAERELGHLFQKLPRRSPLRPVPAGVDGAVDVAAAEHADGDLAWEAAIDTRTRVEQLVEEAIRALPLEDALIVRMRFLEGLSVADVARALSLDQKPLYRRIERLLAELRRRLEAGGVTPGHVASILDEATP